MAEDGQETYFALADFAGDSRPRKLDRSRIGFREHEEAFRQRRRMSMPVFRTGTGLICRGPMRSTAGRKLFCMRCRGIFMDSLCAMI